MNGVVSTVHYWLVTHPTILHFTWVQNRTFASSPLFLASTVIAYLALTFLLLHLPSLRLGPHLLKPITAVHSLALTLLSLLMAVGCSLSALHQAPSRRWILCFPDPTPPSGPTFFWAHVFYLSKVLELVDTILIVAGGSIRRLTFLHVYHHATVLVMCYLWLYTSQSLFPVALVTNAIVHVVMYGYYLSCAVGLRPRWKRAVTDCQILQFGFSFAVSGLMLWDHFSGPGCCGIWAWCFNAVFNASLLVLFVDFYGRSYRRKGEDKRS